MNYLTIIKNIGEIFTASNENTLMTGGDLLIACDSDGTFSFVGAEKSFRKTWPDYETRFKDLLIDADNAVVYPGLIDSHTHIVFAKTREEEFALKAKGASYEEIAAAGGGILNSAEITRKTSFEELYNESQKRLLQAISYGITTIEIKSGYALDTEGELKMLRVIQKLKEVFPVEIIPTFLGAHAFPTEYKNNHRSYIDCLINEMMPQVKEEGLAEYVDVFCEKGYYSFEETKEILEAAKKLGFGLKLHADEFVALGGTELAAKMGAVSVDHLEAVTDEGISLMAESGTVATVLPMTSVFSRLPFAPAKKMIEGGVNLALATDWNPGSSMSGFLPLAASLGATQLQLSVEDSLKGITINAAKAVNREKTKGSIEVGKDADFVIMDADSWIYPVYHFSHNHARQVYIKGKAFTI